MNYRLWNAIESNSEIKQSDKESVYVYLIGYMTVPKSLQASLGTEEEIVNGFVKQSKNLPTIQSCLDKLNWFKNQTQ